MASMAKNYAGGVPPDMAAAAVRTCRASRGLAGGVAAGLVAIFKSGAKRRPVRSVAAASPSQRLG
jgi:hypothetical protein